MIRKLLLVILAAYFLVACAGKDNVEPPAKLMPFSPRATLQKLWSADLGTGSKDMFYALTPASDGRFVYAADVNGRVTARDLLTGKVNWRYTAKKDKALRLDIFVS